MRNENTMPVPTNGSPASFSSPKPQRQNMSFVQQDPECWMKDHQADMLACFKKQDHCI